MQVSLRPGSRQPDMPGGARRAARRRPAAAERFDPTDYHVRLGPMAALEREVPTLFVFLHVKQTGWCSNEINGHGDDQGRRDETRDGPSLKDFYKNIVTIS